MDGVELLHDGIDVQFIERAGGECRAETRVEPTALGCGDASSNTRTIRQECAAPAKLQAVDSTHKRGVTTEDGRDLLREWVVDEAVVGGRLGFDLCKSQW